MVQDNPKPMFSRESFFKFIIIYLQLTQVTMLSLGLFYVMDKSWVSSFANGNVIISSLLIFQFVWIILSWRWCSQQDYLNLYIIFILACFTFNASHCVLHLFGLLDEGILDNRFSDVSIIQSLYFVLVSFSWLHLGALVGYVNSPRKRERIGYIHLTYSSVRFVSILLIALALPFWLYKYYHILQIVIRGGYFAIYQVDKPTGFATIDTVLSGFLVPAALFLLATSRDSRVLRWLAIVILLSEILANLFIGGRGGAAMDTIALLWVWHRSIKKIPVGLVFILGVCALTIFPLIFALRNIPGAERLNFGVWITTLGYVDNPLVASIKEMGGSLQTLVYTLELVPTARPFAYGGTYFWAMTTLLPNFFWDVHPAASAIAAKWLVQTVDPTFAAKGGGYGYSIFAEGYLNFGWLGSILPMFIMGFLISKLLRWESLRFHPAKVGMVASFFSLFIWIARAESISVVRQLFWYSLFPLLLMVLCDEVFRVVFKESKRYATFGDIAVVKQPNGQRGAKE